MALDVGNMAKVEQGPHSGRIGVIDSIFVTRANGRRHSYVTLVTGDGLVSVPEAALYPPISGAESPEPTGRHRK